MLSEVFSLIPVYRDAVVLPEVDELEQEVLVAEGRLVGRLRGRVPDQPACVEERKLFKSTYI